MSGTLYFVAAEASGDELAAEVMRELRKIDPSIDFRGSGGTAMAREGIVSDIDIAPLGVLGFLEGIKAYRTVVNLADKVADAIILAQPDAVVLVDSWGFTLRVAARVRKRAPDIPLYKLVGPQVWATRPGRAKTLAALVDHLFCIHAFEAPFYAPYGLPVTVIGNPAVNRFEPGDGRAFRERYEIDDDREIILVLPGSRTSEIERVAPDLVGAAKLLCDAGDNRICVAIISDSVSDVLEAAKLDWPQRTVFVRNANDKADAMAAGTLALACSGTVTTELASQGCPILVAYRLGLVTYLIASSGFFRSPYITLLNVAAGREIIGEFVQARLSPGRLAEAAERLLGDQTLRRAQIDDQFAALEKMGRGQPPAARLAAEGIHKLVNAV